MLCSQLFGDAASLTEQEEEAIEDSPPPLLVQNDIGVAVTVIVDDTFEVCDVTSVVHCICCSPHTFCCLYF